MYRWILKLYYVLTVPISIFFILNSTEIHPAYKLTFFKKYALGFKMFFNKLRIKTGTSYKAHLAMALMVLETPPDVVGDIIECGTWKGGSAANLSLIARLTGRKLKIFDSFEGLPEGQPEDREGFYATGDYCGTLDEVKRNIEKYGAIECCEFIQGWFEETLPKLDTPVLLAFLDVDLELSLETCVRNIWSNLTDKGYIFIDEYVGLHYCAIFWSEKYWETYFNRAPPGLIGSGIGLALGEYYIGNIHSNVNRPLHHPNAGAFTRKDYLGNWIHFPDQKQLDKEAEIKHLPEAKPTNVENPNAVNS